MLVSYICTLIFLFSAKVCYGYGGEMHKYLGNQIQLNMKELPSSNLAQDSVWADSIKRQAKYSWSRQLHYIDIEECSYERDIDIEECSSESVIKKYCNNNCIYTAILNETNTLYMEGYKQDSFKFLLHFLQDLFQPMHVYGPYRGGNDLHIQLIKNGSIQNTNLHFLWDTIIPMHVLHVTNGSELKVDNLYNFNSMYDYSNHLQTIILKMSDLSCRASDFNRTTIEFDAYYMRFQEEFQNVLQEFINFSISTFKFAFNRI